MTVAALRWIVAGLAVVGLHAGGVWLALNWPRPAEAAGDPPAAIMMELAPLAVSPEAPQQEVAPGPEMVEAEEDSRSRRSRSMKRSSPSRRRRPGEEPRSNRRNAPKVEEPQRWCLPPKVEPPKPKPRPKKKKQTEAPLTTAPPELQTQRADRAAAPAEGHGVVDVANLLARRADGAPQPPQALPVRRGGCGGCDGRVHDRPLRPRAVRALGALGRRLRARY